MEKVTINKSINLSEHMTLGEVTKSRHTEVYNIPSHVAIENLKRVCVWLEELRFTYNALYCLMDYADETKQDYDEILIERNKSGGYWLHFAARPSGNRRKIRLIQT
jgi:hypothetical protein